jgi:hypothetical protein
MFFEQLFVMLNRRATEFDVTLCISNLVFKTPNAVFDGRAHNSPRRKHPTDCLLQQLSKQLIATVPKGTNKKRAATCAAQR